MLVCWLPVAAWAQTDEAAQAQPEGSSLGPPSPDAPVVRVATAEAMCDSPETLAGSVIETAGFHLPGDGGGARYFVQHSADGPQPNGADVIAVGDGLIARLLEREAVNYAMFGAVGDGQNDDGVQIKLAHEYACRHGLPVINRSGDYWIRQTTAIPIQTNVEWGHTRFHIDERYNDRAQPRFLILNDEPAIALDLDDELKARLIERIKPGVQIIPELAPYAGHLVMVRDDADRIGIRAGYDAHRGWAREEFFYVEEEGRVLGDIAWGFTDLTSATATPCSDVYLTIEGGSFHVSGDTPESGESGYHYNGFSIQRSRTVIRDQWVGLEEGRSDESLQARHGFYSLNGVYDVTLENIRAMPWEKDRPGDQPDVPQGTYGIGGARMLNCTFRNLTAEGGWVAWGVFGTNLNKNLRIENCRLNRVDVHFHCWNLYISDSEIGLKGISVTGGGDLFVENTVRHGNSFIHFRPDYGSRWDGRIRLRGCTLKPVSAGGVAVLDYRMADFDYQYPIGFGRDIAIEDLVIDFAAVPDSEAPCWLLFTVPFSRASSGGRLFFPDRITFRDVRVLGRDRGVRLLRAPSPQHYLLSRPGGIRGGRLHANCDIEVEGVQLESLAAAEPGATSDAHLVIGSPEPAEYADEVALYPRIRLSDCEDAIVYLDHCVASATFERCSLNMVHARGLQGELVFDTCRLQPDVAATEERLWNAESTLGTRFTNCTIHAPIVDGVLRPDLVDRLGFLGINGPVRHYHLNTGLGGEVLEYLRQAGAELDRSFIARLRMHHDLED